MKKKIVYLIMIFLFGGPSKGEIHASNCTCISEGLGSDMTTNPLYQGGFIFGSALVSAVTTHFMPWLSTQVRNGNARQFAVDCLRCLLRRPIPKPHPILAMFPALAQDMADELRNVLITLDKSGAMTFHNASETAFYALGDHGYFFHTPSREELEAVVPLDRMVNLLLGREKFASEGNESQLARAVYKLIDQIDESSKGDEIITFKRHLADTYRVWLREGRIYPVLVNPHCISLFLDGGRLEFGMFRRIAIDEDLKEVEQNILHSIETRTTSGVSTSSAASLQVSLEELPTLLEKLTVSPNIIGSRYLQEHKSHEKYQ